MDPEFKSILRGLSLSLRHLLEGYFDGEDRWQPGDLERRLNEIGIWRDRDLKPIDELPHLSKEDLNARKVVDAYLQYRKEAGVSLEESVEEFVRESAYTWANRLFALRCMEARDLIDEVILQKEVYGWRSLQHNRLALKYPQLCAGEDDGSFLMLFQEFERMAEELPQLFNPTAPAVALRPSVAALKQCIALLSGKEPINGQEFCSETIFEAPDAFGWMYQYWNAEEKNRVFEKVRTAKAKIEGADIIPATQLYTEPYMVKFLVQNSLGALWMGMHGESTLVEKWKYYVDFADRAPGDRKSVLEITFLDPACGSGHFLLEAFDIFYDMYKEEGTFPSSEEICASILNNNLFGIDIDERAVQISIAVLWMKAKEKAPKLEAPILSDFHDHLMATNIWLPKHEDHLENFLNRYPEDRPLRAALEIVFEGLNNVDELGSLLQIEEPVEKELRYIRKKLGAQRTLFSPQTDEEWETWRRDVVERLKEHIAAEVASVDLNQFFFSRSAGQGLLFFNLLVRRYDVVATNPPYLGSKNMGQMLKKYVKNHYAPGKRDLYAAFILRCQELVQRKGRIAMVTQQSWMFLRSFVDLRALKEERPKKGGGTSTFKGLLRETTLETLVHLGPRAFVEITGEVVNIALFTLVNVAPSEEHSLTAFRLVGPKSPEEKEALLHSAISNHDSGILFSISQKRIVSIPNSPIVYWLTDGILELIGKSPTLQNVADVRQGLATTDNQRFLRYFWEISSQGERWWSYVKGGGYKKWIGFENLLVDWECDGVRVREIILRDPSTKSSSRRVSSRKYYFRSGLTYSLMGSGGFGVRILEPNSIFDVSGTSIFPKDNISHTLIASLCNAHLSTLLLRGATQSLTYHAGYVSNLHVPLQSTEQKILDYLGAWCCSAKAYVVSSDITESRFCVVQFDNQLLCIFAILTTIEGIINKTVSSWARLGINDLLMLCEETGTPAGWYPLIQGYDSLPSLPKHLPEIPKEVLGYLKRHERRVLSPQELADLKRRLRVLHEAGQGAKVEEENQAESADKEEAVIGAYIPIPSETFLEELTQKLEVHPISVYWLLKAGIEKEGWRCLPEERRVTGDRLTVTILHLLGYRWPKQIEADEPLPDWADPDGIIPLSEGTGEPTLLDRTRERTMADLEEGDVTAIEREFAKIMGKPLEKWLTTEFFKQHTKLFKKRPIAWQLESRPIVSSKRRRGRRRISGGVSEPAFSCIVCYHRLDDDALPKIRSQYVGPLRRRYETELRTLENIQTPMADQTERRLTLENLMQELKEFDVKLEEVITNGFDNTSLRKIVAKESLDKWASINGKVPPPSTRDQLYIQEKAYNPDLNDGVRVNIAPLQKAGLLASEVLSKKDVDKAIRDRAEWRADERHWCREGKLPQPGWWKTKGENT